MYNSDPSGGHKVAFRRCGEGAAAPQTGVYLAAGTSSDGNIGRSKFKDQLINKLITILHWPGRNKPLNMFVSRR